MTRKRLFIIDEKSALNIIKIHFHKEQRRLVEILTEAKVISPDETYSEAELDAATLRLPDREIEHILSNIEY